VGGGRRGGTGEEGYRAALTLTLALALPLPLTLALVLALTVTGTLTSRCARVKAPPIALGSTRWYTAARARHLVIGLG